MRRKTSTLTAKEREKVARYNEIMSKQFTQTHFEYVLITSRPTMRRLPCKVQTWTASEADSKNEDFITARCLIRYVLLSEWLEMVG